MICAKCDQPIRPGQEYDAHDKTSASAAGITIRRTPRLPAETPPVALLKPLPPH